MRTIREKISDLLNSVDIAIDGDHPWDIKIHNENLFQRIIREGSLGLGEAYMDGWWDCESLDEFFTRVLEEDLQEKVQLTFPAVWGYIKSIFSNLQSKSRAYDVGEQHYDIGNDLYEAMLDQRMVYTCGFWDNADNLDDAQQNKLENVCEALDLQPGDRVLDVGCGWGSFARYAAEQYDAEVGRPYDIKRTAETGDRAL